MNAKYIFGAILTLIIGQLSAQDISSKANTFIDLLDAPLKAKTVYPMKDEERFNWHFVPRQRNGPTLHDFSPAQREAALDLLHASMSEQGFQRATNVFKLEKILQGVEGKAENDAYRDPLNYHFTIFGKPSPDKPWGWRLEGHHISLNFSSAKGEIVSATPSFFGSNPAVVPSGKDKGWETLKIETELGLSLVNSLSAEQRKKAVFAETALPDIVSFNTRKAQTLSPGGIAYNELTDDQKKMLLKLLDVYVGNYSLGFSNTLMNKIKKAGIDNLSFGWAGGFERGVGTYYRIQGPMLLIEYDNTQNNANHVHTTVRDLNNDFAEDILKEHYLKEHSK